MKNVVLNQLIYEVETWKRLIVFIKNENLLRVNRLNEIITSGVDNIILYKIENFQEEFLNLESLYMVLNDELVDQHNRLKLVQKDDLENELFRLINLQKQTRNNMEKLINKINKIKADFFQDFSEKLYNFC
jgi:hypothetical protein